MGLGGQTAEFFDAGDDARLLGQGWHGKYAIFKLRHIDQSEIRSLFRGRCKVSTRNGRVQIKLSTNRIPVQRGAACFENMVLVGSGVRIRLSISKIARKPAPGLGF